MAGYSARQSSYTTGDTITAAHSNDEFNQVLAAFNATTGHTHDGTAGEGGPVGSIRDADSLNKVLVDSTNNHLEFYVEVSSAAVQQLRIQDGAIVPITDNDIDLGTSSLEFKDLFIDGTANIDTLSLDGTAITATGAEINLIDGGATVGTTAIADGDGIIHNDGGTMRVTSATTFKTYFQTGVTAAAMAADDLSTGDAAINLETSAGNITIDAQGNDTDIILKGTDGSSDTTFLTIDGSEAGKATFNSDVVVGGDLTVTGDDIIMGTNTAGNLLIADGTNFNSVAVGSLSEISTVANDDVFLAVDTSGGGLKKITRSAVVAGLASSGAISNVVEDSTPQLGGDLDMNGQDIVTTSNADLELAPNGTGHVTVKGNDNPGTIQFNCEQNSHGVQLKGPAHSAGSSAVLTLPTATGTLVATGDTGSVSNDMLAGSIADSKLSTISTAGKVDIGALEIDGATDIGGALADADLFIVDDGAGGTERKAAASRIKTYVGAESGAFSIANLDIDGGTDIGAALADADLLVVDDGAGGTNRKMAASRLQTYIEGKISGDITISSGTAAIGAGVIVNADINSSAAIADSKLDTISTANKVSLAALDIDGGTDIGEDIVDADLFIVDNGAGGTNRKVAASRLITYVNANSSAASTGKAIAMALVFG